MDSNTHHKSTTEYYGLISRMTRTIPIPHFKTQKKIRRKEKEKVVWTTTMKGYTASKEQKER